MRIQWMDPLSPSDIQLPKEMENKELPQELTLKVGSWIKRMKIHFNERLSKDTIGLSPSLFPHLTIPDHLPYDCQWQGSTLLLGPVIAMIVARKEIEEETFEEFEVYIGKYQSIKGLIYLCAEDGIDPLNKTIKGYYYDPEEKEEGCWKEGVFPYPGAVFRRVLLKEHIYHDLLRELRGNIFNAYLFNKYEMWNVLSNVAALRSHLPETAPLVGLRDFLYMIERYRSVYLKPIYGGYGLGILKVDKTANGYHLYDSQEIDKLIQDRNELGEELKKLAKYDYIVQQSVPFLHDQRLVDFRVILQKDKSKTWKSTGFMARYGRTEKIYTNNVSEIEKGKQTLQELLSLSEEEALLKEQEIINLCIKAAILLEKYYARYGVYGDLGIDVIVDPNQHVWLLEINKFHDHDMALYVDDDPDLFDTIVTTPLEYAKALAGFN